MCPSPLTSLFLHFPHAETGSDLAEVPSGSQGERGPGAGKELRAPPRWACLYAGSTWRLASPPARGSGSTWGLETMRTAQGVMSTPHPASPSTCWAERWTEPEDTIIGWAGSHPRPPDPEEAAEGQHSSAQLPPGARSQATGLGDRARLAAPAGLPSACFLPAAQPVARAGWSPPPPGAGSELGACRVDAKRQARLGRSRDPAIVCRCSCPGLARVCYSIRPGLPPGVCVAGKKHAPRSHAPRHILMN